MASRKTKKTVSTELPEVVSQPIESIDVDVFEGMNKQDDSVQESINDAVDGVDESGLDYLARMANDEFTKSKAAKFIQEQLLIRCHLNEKGVYPADTDFNGGTSRPFVQVTRPKVMNAHSRLVEVLLTPGEDCWSVEETPNPYMPQLMMELVLQGMDIEDIKKRVKLEASKAARAMHLKVRDGLCETSWDTVAQETFLHMCIYGTSIVMAPRAVKCLSTKDDARRGVESKAERALKAIIGDRLKEFGIQDEYRPEIECISPFEFYPDPGGKRVEDLSYAFVRKVLNKSQLADLAKVDGFKSDSIKEVLDMHPTGNWAPEYWENVITVANSQQQIVMPNGRYVTLIRWGYISGADLKKAGVDVDEDEMNQQVMCQMWTVGNKVIFLQASELYRSRIPFYVTPYSHVPHSIWGAGPAEFMMDSQDGINACERAKFDNMGFICRPMCEVNVSRLADGSDTLSIQPGKMFPTKDTESSNNKRVVEFYTPPSVIAEIQAVQQSEMALADEQTNIPKNLMGMGGEGVHNRTLGGASLQFNNAIVPLKGVAYNIDVNLMTPLIRDMVAFYNNYSSDTTIKGDHKIVARGVTGLMAREVASQKLQSVLAVAAQNPDFSRRIDMTSAFNLLFKGSGLDGEGIILTEAELQARMEAEMQQQQIAQAAGKQMQADIETNAAKMRAETSPNDVLLQSMEAVPDSCVALKLAMIRTCLMEAGKLTPELSEYFNNEMELQSIKDEDAVHNLATEQATRELGPIDLHKMKNAERMAQIKANSNKKGMSAE